jgi:hypothetical protein
MLGLPIPANQNKVTWTPGSLAGGGRPLTWHRATLAATGTGPFALDLSTMGKGNVWINGHHLGRYWSIMADPAACDNCDYRGEHNPDRCRQGCGGPSQALYHVPPDWLDASGSATNNLVLLEEIGGNVSGVQLVQREADVVCASIGEDYPADDLLAKLECTDGQQIDAVEFASFGTPVGDCRQYSLGTCHADNSTAIVAKACVGQPSCAVPVSIATFGDPCPNHSKRLSVQVRCSPTTTTTAAAAAPLRP